MSIGGILISLTIGCALAAYLFYAHIAVPFDIEERDKVFWIFVKNKYNRGLVSLY